MHSMQKWVSTLSQASPRPPPSLTPVAHNPKVPVVRRSAFSTPQMRKKVKLGLSVKQKEGELVEPSPGVTPKSMKDDLPSYGAQHRQDALWEGGNEALPPGWQEFKIGRKTDYQDDMLDLVTWKQPLPGIRLDYCGCLLVPGCEWHISPLGRSYFVNHNDQTTSWVKPIPKRPLGSLTPQRIIEDHAKAILSFACVGAGHSIISASGDGSIRQWTRDGRIIGRPWRSDGVSVTSIAVSPDETMVATGSADGRIRLWNIKEGRMIDEPWKAHNAEIMCLDWSSNAQKIASVSDDGTIRRWYPTGQQIVPSIEVDEGFMKTVKYAPKDDKFAACGTDDMIYIWSKDGKLLTTIGEPNGFIIESLCWSTDGTCIFSGSTDSTIRKWRLIDGEELVVFRGHADRVMSLYLSTDECYLLSASWDSSVRIWDLGTNKPVSEPLWHDSNVATVALSPNKQYIASCGQDRRIYLWNFEAALKQSRNQSTQVSNVLPDTRLKEQPGDMLDVPTKSQPRLNQANVSKYGDNFWQIDPLPSPYDPAPLTSTSPHRRKWFDFLRFNFQSEDSSTQMPRQRRRWNVSLSPNRVSSHTADQVAAARDDDRYYVSPPTDAEVAAAMKDEPGIAANGSAHQGRSAPGVQGPQQGTSAPMAQGQNSIADTDERPYVIGCCGIFLVLGGHRPFPHS